MNEEPPLRDDDPDEQRRQKGRIWWWYWAASWGGDWERAAREWPALLPPAIGNVTLKARTNPAALPFFKPTKKYLTDLQVLDMFLAFRDSDPKARRTISSSAPWKRYGISASLSVSATDEFGA